MELMMSPAQHAALVAAAGAEQRTRSWKRYQAVLLVAEGATPAAAARAVRCHVASVYWTRRERRAGLAGLAEGRHPGAARRLDTAGEARLEALLGSDPQTHGHRATGWTVALLRTELVAAGYVVSPRTVRRAVHRLGYRWKRPQYVLGRPDPHCAAKKGA